MPQEFSGDRGGGGELAHGPKLILPAQPGKLGQHWSQVDVPLEVVLQAKWQPGMVRINLARVNVDDK